MNKLWIIRKLLRFMHGQRIRKSTKQVLIDVKLIDERGNPSDEAREIFRNSHAPMGGKMLEKNKKNL